MNNSVDKIHTDVNLYVQDKDFNESVKNRMGSCIEDGLDAVEAAKHVGISPSKFHRWMQADELFRNFISGQERLRNAKLKKTILTTIKKIKDPDKKQKAYMDYLKHIDKEFGAKYIKSEGIEIKATVDPAGMLAIREKIEATRIKKIG